MTSNGSRWWTRWPTHIYRLAPSVTHVVLGIAVFAACALIFLAVANPPTPIRVVLALVAVVGLTGILGTIEALVQRGHPARTNVGRST